MSLGKEEGGPSLVRQGAGPVTHHEYSCGRRSLGCLRDMAFRGLLCGRRGLRGQAGWGPRKETGGLGMEMLKGEHRVWPAECVGAERKARLKNPQVL